MNQSLWKRLLVALGILVAAAFTVKYILPTATPFLLGALVAVAAEPLVRTTQRRFGFSRGWAAGVGVSLTLVLLVGVLCVLSAFLLKELMRLASSLPDLEHTAKDGIGLLKNWLTDLSYAAPDGLQPVLTRAVDGVFSGSGEFMKQATARIPTVLSGVLSGVPDSALKLGTGLLASFMISARLPKLKAALSRYIPKVWKEQYLPALIRTKKALGGWLKAQGTLSALTYAIVSVGFLLLRIPYGFFWAILVALIDAVPMLGTGIILIPWALIGLLQRQPLQAVGLLLTFGAATLTRTALEPKFVGKQLGLDPLLTLVALYTGYRLWGFGGLLAAPILTAAVKSFLLPPDENA